MFQHPISQHIPLRTLQVALAVLVEVKISIYVQLLINTLLHTGRNEKATGPSQGASIRAMSKTIS